MTDQMLEPSRQRLASLLAARSQAAAAPSGIPARPDPAAPVPLTPIQRRLWFLWQLEPDSVAYLMPWVVRLRGPVDPDALTAAVRDLLDRHDVLRTVVMDHGGEPAATVAPVSQVPFVVDDLGGDETALTCRLQAQVRPFALDREPASRVLLARMADDDWVLALTVHHIASDGHSQDLLLHDLADLYAARLGLRPTPEPPRQFADVAAWLHHHRDSTTEQQQLDWWLEQLADTPPVLELPTDRPRPAQPTWSSDALRMDLPPDLAAAVRARAAETGSTPFVVLMAGLQVLLSRLAGTDDVVVGMPEAGRRHVDTEKVVGCFLNTLVVRGDLSGDPTGRELISRVRGQVTGALAHADVPFERIVEELSPDRNLGASPLFQVQLNVVPRTGGAARFPGLRVEPIQLATRTAKVDLAFGLLDLPDGGLPCILEYRTELFDRSGAQGLADRYLHVLAQLVADLDRPISALRLTDRAGPLLRGRRVERQPESLISLFYRQAAAYPDTVAVVGPDGRATYAELEERVNRIAHRLIASGVSTDTPVGVLLEPGVEAAAAILGVMAAGGCYLPIDPTYPTGRVAEMLDTAGAGLVVTSRALADRISQDRQALYVDDPQVWAGLPTTGPDVTVDPEQLAHVIFTSGSTGTPKGVAVPHRGLVNCVQGMLEHTPTLAGASFAVVSTLSADLALAAFYGALLSGGTLHLVDRETATDPQAYAAYLATHRVDMVKMVPSHLSMLTAHHTGHLSDLLPKKVLVFGGEAVPWTLVDQVRDASPGLVVQTHYGPTESSMFSFICTTSKVTAEARAHSGSVPLGELLPNIGAYVVDHAGQPAPLGIPGELVLAGPGVSRGYISQPDLTGKAFIPHPDEPGQLCYRTGDRVRIHPDHTVEFLGRVDDQIKVRGYRVEPGEVAAACRTHPGIHNAFVAAVGDAHQRRLVAWLAAPGGVDQTALRDHLRSRLPDHLVPAAFVILDALPLTPNGKINRRALPEPQLGPQADRQVEPPATPTEQAIADTWAHVLDLQIGRISRSDDFFAIGGHSFAATRAIGRLRQQLGRDIPLRLLFEHPVLADLATAIDRSGDTGGAVPGSGPIPVRDRSTPVPITSAQQRLWFLTQLEPDSSAYHVPLLLGLHGDLDVEALAGAVTDLVTRHEILRTVVIDDLDGEPTGKVLPPEAVTMAVVDTTAEELPSVARRAAEQPFRLDEDPPLRVTLYRLGDDRYALGIVFHHIAVDAWSVGLAVDDLAACYTARINGAPPPPAPTPQYADYAAWVRSDGPAAAAAQAAQWWARRLAGAPPVLTLPTDRPRPPVAALTAAAVPVEIPPAEAARLREVAAAHQATPFMVLLAAWQLVLGRLAGTDDVVVGVPVSGRHHPDTEHMVGCFINTLALRTDLSGNPTVADLLARVRTSTLDAFAHAHAPFEQVVERIRPPRDPSTTPVFQVMLNVIEDNRGAPRFSGLSVEILVRPETTSTYDLNLGLITTSDGGYQGMLSYRADLFDTGTVQRWLASYRRTLAAMLADQRRPVSDIPVGDVDGVPAGPRDEPRSVSGR